MVAQGQHISQLTSAYVLCDISALPVAGAMFL